MIWLLFLGVGALAGVISGLTGVGGGTVVVPLLVLVLASLPDIPNAMVIKVAIATSFLVMVFTTLYSIYIHHTQGSVCWRLMPRMLPGLLIGVFIGGYLVHLGESRWLQLLFALFVIFTGLYMLAGRNAETGVAGSDFSYRLFDVTALAIGFMSGLFGIGGGTFNVPNLHKRGLPIINAIATAAAAGWPIAVMGALILMLSKPQQEIPQALGYIYLPAVLGISATSVIFSGLGAKLTYLLPVRTLKTLFALFLVVVGIRQLTMTV